MRNFDSLCFSISDYFPGIYVAHHCFWQKCESFLCEKNITEEFFASKKSVVLSKRKNNGSTDTSISAFIICPGGHITHTFLSCDSESHCGVDEHPTHCPLISIDNGNRKKINVGGYRSSLAVQMFQCHEYGGTIPYTLVCDFRNDCKDNSDERHCRHGGRSAASFRYASSLCQISLLSLAI